MQAARQAGALGGSSDGFLTDPASVSPDAVRHHEAHVLPGFPARKCAAPEGPGPQGSFMTDSLLFQVRLERACRVEVDRAREDTGLAAMQSSISAPCPLDRPVPRHPKHVRQNGLPVPTGMHDGNGEQMPSSRCVRTSKRLLRRLQIVTCNDNSAMRPSRQRVPPEHNCIQNRLHQPTQPRQFTNC
jgi:hypothetical protein